MNIKLAVFTIVVFFMTSVWASAVDADKKKDAESKDAVQDKEVVQATDAAQAADEDAEDPNEWICKRIQKTGTRFKSKVCGTRRQWEESERQGKEATENMRNRPTQGRDTG